MRCEKLKSIKPGRGPSGMSFIGSIVAIIFGVFWTIIATTMSNNAPFGIVVIIFPLFGVIFIILGIVQAVYHYKNARGKNRYSMFDITDSTEESDPANKWIQTEEENIENKHQHKFVSEEMKYCPYCGLNLEGDYNFCPKCGKKIK